MKKNILFLGPPGAGKGTQASIISECFSYLHLSTGELLRQEVQNKTNLGSQVEEIMNNGQLVSDELVLEIVKKNLSLRKNGWILDGYPRNLSQANSLEEVLNSIDQPLEIVFNLKVKEDLLVSRLLKRGRPDDNEEIIRTRLKIYQETTKPLINYFKKMKILEDIQGDRDLKTISTEIKQKMVA
tara:strand:+ start:395 stop:946 length:552 start_codon:yes stop_codon:yes gene_type:complete